MEWVSVCARLVLAFVFATAVTVVLAFALAGGSGGTTLVVVAAFDVAAPVCEKLAAVGGGSRLATCAAAFAWAVALAWAGTACTERGLPMASPCGAGGELAAAAWPAGVGCVGTASTGLARPNASSIRLSNAELVLTSATRMGR
jgi:hypothetical protein